jgi:3-oxoacyl-[acyl-carrier-protein] synthase II
MKRRVVVTGMGVVTPLACDVPGLWENILQGKSGIHPLTILDVSQHKVRFGGDIPQFDPSGCVDPKETKRLDRFTLFAIHAARQAVAESGLNFDQEDLQRCGAIIGSGVGGLTEIEDQILKLAAKGPDRVSPFTVPKMMLNAAGGNIAILFGLHGPNFAVATACASAANAMGDALRMIQHGDVDVMVTGGSEAGITHIGLSSFANMKALSSRNEEPHRASRPFDRDRDGFVLSEGAGILIFEELEHARRRGAPIYAEILGFGTSCDAGHITQPDPCGAGAAQAMASAIANARLNPEDVDYINAHGTSTPLGDKAETVAIKSVFGPSAKRVSVSSTKGHLGHSLGASGGIEMVLAIQSVFHGLIPPTINLENADPECDLDYTPLQPRERPIRVAINNSFGFGGHNSCLVCAKLA